MDAQVAKAKESVLMARMQKATEVRSKALDGMNEKRKHMVAAADARRAAIRDKQRADEERRRHQQEEWAREAYYKSQPRYAAPQQCPPHKSRRSCNGSYSMEKQSPYKPTLSPAYMPVASALEHEKNEVLKLKDGPLAGNQAAHRPSGDGDELPPPRAPVAARAAAVVHSRVAPAAQQNVMAKLNPSAAVAAAARMVPDGMKIKPAADPLGETVGFGSPIGAA